ncbi:MAG: nucleoside deaminase [Microscillaceae bacterium]|nr:nucleoside deaminase [Microscillaceae bacterium]
MTHEYYMQMALREAQLAYEEGEIPVGAVIVGNGQVLAKAHNQTERLQDPTAHAEMLALTAATYALGAKYLHHCALYVTLEPCLMCAGAIFWTQPGLIVFGTADAKRGYQRFQALQPPHTPLHPKTQVIGGLLEAECQEILSRFFQNLRK